MIDLRRASARGRPSIMGILNVTPDSFSDGGKWDSPRLAVEHEDCAVLALQEFHATTPFANAALDGFKK